MARLSRHTQDPVWPGAFQFAPRAQAAGREGRTPYPAKPLSARATGPHGGHKPLVHRIPHHRPGPRANTSKPYGRSAVASAMRAGTCAGPSGAVLAVAHGVGLRRDHGVVAQAAVDRVVG